MESNMSFELNKKLINMKPYDPVCGRYRIRLDANESFIVPSDDVIQSIKERMADVKFNRYPDPYATELCGLFANFYGVKSELVTAGNGSDELISVIMNAFLQKGDTVMCFAPDFSMYSFYSEVVEANCLVLPKDENFNIDIDNAINQANENKTRMIVFSNPCNPTSIGMTKERILKLIQNVRSLVVLDEAYMDFYGQSLLDEVEKYDNLIILRTCSKAMGMAAIRLGFAVANKTLTNALKCVKSPYNVNAVTQAIGCAVFSNQKSIRKAIERINSSRDLLVEELKKVEKLYPEKLKIIANSANFVYTKVYNAQQMFEFLKSEGIIVRCFGDYLRITAGRNHENMEIAASIAKFLCGGKKD